MATRKQFQTNLKVTPAIKRRLAAARKLAISEEDLKEQAASFIYGNAPVDSKLITKASARTAVRNIRLRSTK